jgi:toxin ParE1/3/4
MPRILRTPAAEEDVWEIALYIALDNEAAAVRLLDRFDKTFRMLADFPRGGPARPELGENVRSFPVGNYLVFYRPLDDGIEILRVLHGARDLRRIFGQH